MMIVRDDMLAGIARNLDTQFYAGAESAGVSPGGITVGVAPIDGAADGSLASVSQDLKACINALLAANIPMTRPGWLINPQNVEHLRWIINANGAYVFKNGSRAARSAVIRSLHRRRSRNATRARRFRLDRDRGRFGAEHFGE
jgi:hypothetical protein